MSSPPIHVFHHRFTPATADWYNRSRDNTART